MSLSWKKVKSPSGLVQHIEDSTGNYRISRSFNGTRFIFTAWRRNQSLLYGSEEECKKSCYDDSLKPDKIMDRELALEALMNARELLRGGKYE